MTLTDSDRAAIHQAAKAWAYCHRWAKAQRKNRHATQRAYDGPVADDILAAHWLTRAKLGPRDYGAVVNAVIAEGYVLMGGAKRQGHGNHRKALVRAARAAELRKRGLTDAAIAKRIGVRPETVRGWAA